MKRLLNILLLIMLVQVVVGQMNFQYPYFPKDVADSSNWNWQVSPFFNQQAGSNTFTNEFFRVINKSEFLSSELIDKQIDNMSGSSLSGQITNIGLGLKINAQKNPGKSYVNITFEHQHYLDASLDDDLVKLLLKGNKPYAGQTLRAPNSSYYNVYFNQLKAGLGHRFLKNDAVHEINWMLGFNIGQNHNNLEVHNSSLFTEPEGDYLDVTASMNIELSDTAWAEVYEANGYGFSADLEYTYTKPEKFHVGISFKNLGMIFWNGNTFSGERDTSFVFSGLNNDTISGENENIPNDFSYDNLRRLLFTSSSTENFSTTLPIGMRFTLGKYLAGDKFFLGVNSTYYPMLVANYDFEFFATWNYRGILYLTPIVGYSSYANVNLGLGVGVKIVDELHLHIGSRYLNSMFNQDAKIGSGGFARLTLVL
ncbi:MAG: DUF5723 family protein [Bacteroidales bacterium]